MRSAAKASRGKDARGGIRGRAGKEGAKKAERRKAGQRQRVEVLKERERPDGLSHAGRFWRDIS